jgi:hypothetical protein
MNTIDDSIALQDVDYVLGLFDHCIVLKNQIKLCKDSKCLNDCIIMNVGNHWDS